MSAVKGLALHALLEEGPGVRLYFSRRDRQPFRVLSLDVCSDRLMERMEFGLPQDGRDLSFVRFAERTHCAYVAGGALFVDGILLCACPDDARPELESQGGELMCRLSSTDGVRSFVFRDQGWSVMKGENVQRNIPADLPSPVPVSPVPSVPETESFREILHNQAMLLRTLREKQELLERKTFAMEARLQAQSAQSEQLRRRTEGLQAALEALERLGLRPQG